MKKQTWNYLLIAIIIGVIIYAGVSSQQTVLSLSQLQITEADDRDSIFNKATFLVTYSQGLIPSQRIITYSVDSDDFNSKGYSTKGGFSFESKWEKQQCVYGINSVTTDDPIVTYGYYYTSSCSKSLTSSGEQTDLNNFIASTKVSTSKIVDVGLVDVSGTYIDDCYLIYENSYNEVGSLNSPSYRVKGNISISANDGLETVSDKNTFSFDNLNSQYSSFFCKDGSTSCGVNDEKTFAYVEYQGSLITGKTCPDYNVDYVPVYNNNLNQWIVVDETLYTSYLSGLSAEKTRILNVIDSYNSRGYLNKEEIIRQVTYLNNYPEKALVDKTSSLGTIENKVSSSTSKIVYTSQEDLVNPLMSLYISADAVGIYTPSVNLELVGYENPDQCILTGGNGYIPITIKNNGGVQASITFTTVCSNGFDTSTEKVTLNGGDSETYYINFNPDVSTHTEGKCTVTITEVTSGFKKVVTTNVCADPIGLACSLKGETYCGVDDSGNEVVYKCSSDGQTETPIEICEIDQICENADCVDIIVPCVGISCGIRCSDSYFSFLTDASTCDFCDSKTGSLGIFAIQCATFNAKDYFPYLFFVLGGLLTYWLISMKYKPKKEFKVIVIILSLVVAFILFLITDLIVEHWIISGIIGTILLIIAYFVMKVGRYIP